MYDFLITLCGISAVMGLITLVIYACRKILRNKFSAGCRYVLWLLIILRLCIPVSAMGMPSLIEIPFPRMAQAEGVGHLEAIQPIVENENNGVPDKTPTENYENEVTVPSISENSEQNVPSVPPIVADVDSPSINVAPESFAPGFEPDEPTASVIPDSGNTENATPQPYLPEEAGATKDVNYFVVIFAVWLIVAVGFLTFDLVKYFVFLKDLRKTVAPADERLQGIYKKAVIEGNIGNSPKLYVSGSITSPMLVGVVKPMIVLPMLTLDDEAWSGIISHELTHYKRHDLWAKLASIVAKSLHWFNPIVHLAVRMMNEEMELSCDEKTLKNVSEERRLKYGTVMVDILKSCKGRVNAFSTHFNPNKNTAKGRIMNILDVKKKRKGITLISLCLVLCIASGSIFGCAKQEQEELPKATESVENTLPEETNIDETVPAETNIAETTPSETEPLETEEPKVDETKSSATTLDELMQLDVDDRLKNMAKALLTNDTETMAELANCKAETYDEYKKIEFGKFEASVTNTTNKGIEITVEVKNVPDILSFADNDGTVTLNIEIGMNGVLLSDPTVVNAIKSELEYYKQEPYFLAGWFGTPSFDYELKQAAFVDADEMSDYSKWLYDFLYHYVKLTAKNADSYTDKEIADMCKEYATEMFVLTDHSGYNKVFRENESGELVYANGHGGRVASYVIEGYTLFDENGMPTDNESEYSYSNTYILVFADPGRTVMSRRIAYTITPGEIFPKFFTYEVVDDSKYDPYPGFSV